MNDEATKTLQRIAAQTAKDAENTRSDIRHNEALTSDLQTQEVIVRTISSLVDYLDNRISKTVVVNQLKEVGTPDAYKVVDAVNALHGTLRAKEDIDLSEVTNLLRASVEELAKIPKSHSDIKIPDPVDNTKQFSSLETAIKAVDKSIKAQKLSVEAPVVNVPAPEVNVEAPDLTQIKKEQETTRKELKKALKDLVFPTTDLTKLEKESAKHTKLLKELVDKPTGGGAGGGGRATPYQDSNDIPAFVTVEADGSLPTTIKNTDYATSDKQDELIAAIEALPTPEAIYSKPTDAYAISNIEDTGTYKYFGFENSTAGWYIMRKTLADNTFLYSSGGSNYATAWTNRASQTYASYGSTF